MDSTDPNSDWSAITELRLNEFKSFRDAVLPLGDLTLIVGRNGSGKSNALEALETLAHLVSGTDIRDAIDGSRLTAAPIRGGVEGSAPYGSDRFSLGCVVTCATEQFEYEITISVAESTQVIAEQLTRVRGGVRRDLFHTTEPDPASADISARYYNGKRGLDPAIAFRASRPILGQVATRVPTGTKAEREVHEGAERVIDALRSVFVLDPVPQMMREYVPIRDSQLRRQADNLSAAVARIRQEPVLWSRLLELVRALPENPVTDISVERSSLGDVIIALHESFGAEDHPVSARLMSDGMLRYIAFATALLEPHLANVSTEDAQTTLVIEEIENGLHPSQAERVVRLLKEESRRRPVRALATTHSPALLAALDASDHPAVIICDRDVETGMSRLRRLTELPAYERFMAQGSLGDAITRGRLGADMPSSTSSSAIDELIAGI
jgi:predicted ATPase